MPALRAVRKKHSKRSRTRQIVWRVVFICAVIAVLFPLVLMLLGLGVSADIGCTGCHSMQPYSEAAVDSPHASLDCSDCHATGGVLGYLTDGMRAITWVGVPPAGVIQTASFDVAGCLDCHESITDGAVVANAIAVRHQDFLDVPCTECHGGTGHAVKGHWYRLLAMEDCTSCHRTSLQNIDACETCHVPGEPSERREGTNAWRATHGEGWRETHGMGDLDTCTSCHVPRFCIGCHAVRVPHLADWVVEHGRDVSQSGREVCETCHDQAWCGSCHQIQMPHSEDFLPLHGPEAVRLGEEVCSRCHQQLACDMCHFESSHPNVPGLGMVHGL